MPHVSLSAPVLFLALAQVPFNSEFITSSSFATTPLERASAIVANLNLPDPPKNVAPITVVSAQQLRHKPPKKAKQAYDRATKLTQAKKFLEATLELEEAIRIDPDYAFAHNNLGVNYFMLGRREEAMAHYLRALELDPSLPDAHTNIATAAMLAGDLPRAESEARRALTLAPTDQIAADVLASVRKRR